MDQVGPLIVPATYVPSTTVVCPEELENLMEKNPDLPRGILADSQGEMAEKEVYDFLHEYYGKKKGAALVINNNILVHPNATKKEINDLGTGKQEADFLIADKDSQILINIEVKQFLGKYPSKLEKDWPTTKVKK